MIQAARRVIALLLLACVSCAVPESRLALPAADALDPAFDPAREVVLESTPAVPQEAAPAQAPTRTIEDWRFGVAAYGWIADVSGTTISNGTETGVEVPFEQAVENTEAGFQLYAEARWKKFYAAFDGTWANLGAENDGLLVKIEPRVKQRIYELRAGYTFLHEYLDPVPEPDEFHARQLTADVFLGARYFSTEIDTTITPIVGTPSTVSFQDKRWDPIFGVRGAWDPGQRWQLTLRGDIGGFGIGNAAQFTWQLEATAGFRIVGPLAVFAGYRVLSFDTVTGDGANRNGADMTQQGMLLGLGASF